MTVQMTEALLKWLSTFKSENVSQSELKTWNDVSDGVAMAKVLNKIDSSHFTAGKKREYKLLDKNNIKAEHYHFGQVH